MSPVLQTHSLFGFTTIEGANIMVFQKTAIIHRRNKKAFQLTANSSQAYENI